MNMRYLLAAALLVVLTGCQAVAPGEATSATPPTTSVATPEMTGTVETEGTVAVTDTAPTEATASATMTETEEITETDAATSTGVQGSGVNNYATLVDALRAAGMTVESTGEVSQPFLAVPGQQLQVNGGNVQVFEYASAEVAAADANQIAPDGSSTATTMITWVEPPHFYRKDQLLVLYVGSDEAIQDLLTSLLGPQFAGQ